MAKFLVALLLLPSLSTAAFADTVVWEQLPGSQVGGPAVFATWSHTNPGSINVFDQRLGDNFSLSSTQSITSVDWWGYDGFPGFASFTIAFFTTAGLASGIPVYSEVVPVASITTTGPVSGYYDSQYSVAFTGGSGNGGSVVLGADTYWLAISADNDPSQIWAWMGADVATEQYDGILAFDGDLTNPEWDGTFGPLGHPGEDRSFRLYAGESHIVPLPPAAWLGVPGMVLLAGIRRFTRGR